MQRWPNYQLGSRFLSGNRGAHYPQFFRFAGLTQVVIEPCRFRLEFVWRPIPSSHRNELGFGAPAGLPKNPSDVVPVIPASRCRVGESSDLQTWNDS